MCTCAAASRALIEHIGAQGQSALFEGKCPVGSWCGEKAADPCWANISPRPHSCHAKVKLFAAKDFLCGCYVMWGRDTSHRPRGLEVTPTQP